MPDRSIKLVGFEIQGEGGFIAGTNMVGNVEEPAFNAALSAADEIGRSIRVVTAHVDQTFHPAGSEKRMTVQGIFDGQKGSERWAIIFEANPTGGFQGNR